jgi:hypothetical protein
MYTSIIKNNIMRLRILSIATVILLGNSALFAQEAAQDTTWKKGGLIGIGMNQVSLSNWAAGGFSSISANANINLFANRDKGNSTWENNLLLGYGLLKQGEGDVEKTDDRIDFTSKYGVPAWNDDWSYAGLANFRTQFTDGESAPDADGNRTVISRLMAPGYLLASAGLNYKPDDNFSFYFSPLTAKFTFVTDDLLSAQGAFGVGAGVLGVDAEGNITVLESGETSRSEFGGYVNAAYNKTIMENVTFITRIDLFSNYENPTLIDVNWDALITMKINDYITTSLGATVLYDHDIQIAEESANGEIKVGPRTQFRNIFGIGFAYAL